MKLNVVRLWPVLLLLVISLMVTFYKFNQIPQYLAFDETELAKVAISLNNKPYTPFSPLADGHATVYFYILLFFLKTWGISSFVLRLPSAICGVISSLLFYFIMQEVSNTFSIIIKKKKVEIPLALPLSIIFATLHWYVDFTRFSFEMPFLLTLELASLFCALRYWKKSSVPMLICSGIFAGLAFNSYQPGRIFFLVPLLLLVLKKDRLKSSIIYLLTFVIVIAPLTFYLITNRTIDSRFNQQFYLKNSQLSVIQKISYLTDNISREALMFPIRGDINGRHNYPGKAALNPILSLLFVAGLGIGVWQWKKRFNLLFIWYFLIALAPTILTYPWENPNMLRSFTVIPATVYFIGLSLQFILQKFQKKYFVTLLLLVIVVISCIYELRTYFHFQRIVFLKAFEVKQDLQSTINIPSNTLFKTLFPPK